MLPFIHCGQCVETREMWQNNGSVKLFNSWDLSSGLCSISTWLCDGCHSIFNIYFCSINGDTVV